MWNTFTFTYSFYLSTTAPDSPIEIQTENTKSLAPTTDFLHTFQTLKNIPALIAYQ